MNTKKHIIYLFVVFLLFNCTEEEEVIAAAPEIEITDIGEVTLDAVQVTSIITSDGGDMVSARGLCWSTSPNPTIDDSTTSDGTGTGTFISTMTSLVVNTTYYIKAYAVNSTGTSYSNQYEINTDLPEVTTNTISNIMPNTVDVEGEVTDEGGSSVTVRGICWGTNPNPTISDNTIENGVGIGSYISTLTNMMPGTTYYIRAYATNSIGVTYGNEIEYNTNLPTVTTSAIANIMTDSAEGGGEIVEEGGSSVIARGICWSTNPNPTIDDTITVDGTGAGVYTSMLTGLTAETVYYVRAYATNSLGTAYGNEVTFNTNLPTVTTTAISNITMTSADSGGEVTDEGGTSVTTKGICWSTEPNPTIEDNITNDGNGIGVYTSTIDGISLNSTYYVRAYATNSIGTSYGQEEILETNILPTVTTAEIINVTSTSAESGGEVISEGSASVTTKGICWSTEPNPTIEDNTTNDGNGIGVYTSTINGISLNSTYYVRAYATSSIGTSYGQQEILGTNLPQVTTQQAVYHTDATALIDAEVINEGSANVTERGVCWSTTPTPTLNDNSLSNGDGLGSYSVAIDGLMANANYYIRAYAINNLGVSYGDEIAYQSTPCYNDPTTTSVITLTTQQEVDNFNYYSVGGLNIVNTSISDLSPLMCLKVIDGDLTIINNPSLVSLTGLEGITTINGYIKILNNSSLTSINLDNFMSVNSGNTYWEDASPTFSITGNTSLLSINMPNLQGFGGALFIHSNSLLTSINMSSLNGLSVLSILGNTELSSVNFNSLSSIGTVAIGNGSLRGIFAIRDTKLTNLDGFGSLSSTKLEYLTIANNPLLENLNMLSNATIESTSTTLENNASLINIQGLSNAGIVNEEISLVVNNNDALTNIDALSGYMSNLLSSIQITNNDALTSIDALSGLGACLIAGVTITNNNSLSDLCPLASYANAVLNYGYCGFNVSGNVYNPSAQDIVDGNCSQ
ncbi:hypothetical protein EZY14_019125 [Kordia sp. TARA_039_SRF]|nr:hypothetical protein EZY14_019125 [Kordia sp. TARA_039_SRF]